MSDVWGTVPAWLSAVGGTGALLWLTSSNVRESRDRRRVHAAKISTVCEYACFLPSDNRGHRQIHVVNTGTQPIYDVHVFAPGPDGEVHEDLGILIPIPFDRPGPYAGLQVFTGPDFQWNIYFFDVLGRGWRMTGSLQGVKLRRHRRKMPWKAKPPVAPEAETER